MDLAQRPRATDGAALRDRKSTRLNSSHGYISYAGFCLKKKKNAIQDFYSARPNAILPSFPSGSVTLLAATTANPTFQITSPSLSLSHFLRLEQLAQSD